MTEKRTHHIGVRVTRDELRRIKLRAKALSPHSPTPPASYLRRCGLDTQPDPSPELVEILGQVLDQWKHCQQNLNYDEPVHKALTEANKLLREIIRRFA